MKIRRALAEEAEACWNIRNLAIREGCKTAYSTAVINAWTPDVMPEDYRKEITQNPFFVAEDPRNGLVATGYLDLAAGSVEAIFTLPDYFGKGCASKIIEAIKSEAEQRGLKRLTLSSTQNAQSFYQQHGFLLIGEDNHFSGLAQAELRCMHMFIDLVV